MAENNPDIHAGASAPLPVYGVKLREMTGPYQARNKKLVTAFWILDQLGRLLGTRKVALPQNRPLRVLVANWGHFGDVVNMLPLIKYLEQHEMIGELGILVGSWACVILDHSDIKARIYTLDHWALNRGKLSRKEKFRRYARMFIPVVNQLKMAKYDVSIDAFSTFPVTHFVTWCAGIPRRIGFDSAGMGTWLTDPLKWIADDIRIIDQQIRLLQPIFGDDCPKSLAATYPGFQPVNLPENLGIEDAGHVIFHMGSGDPERNWVTDKWIHLANLLGKKGYKVITTGSSEQEMSVAKSVAEKAGTLNAAGRLTWAQFVTLISKAQAVITADTVTGHLAACFNIPAVVLTAGRHRIAFWRPNSPRAISLTHRVGCYPCYRSHGCETMACVRFIETEEVWNTFCGLLDKKA